MRFCLFLCHVDGTDPFAGVDDAHDERASDTRRASSVQSDGRDMWVRYT